jgi:hypothetical protein
MLKMKYKMSCIHNEYTPEGTDLFAAAVFLLEHQTGMGSHKNKFFVSETRNEGLVPSYCYY